MDIIAIVGALAGLAIGGLGVYFMQAEKAKKAEKAKSEFELKLQGIDYEKERIL